MKDKIKVYSSDGSENHSGAQATRPSPILFKREVLSAADRNFDGRFEDLRARAEGEKHPIEIWLQLQGLSGVLSFCNALREKTQGGLDQVISTFVQVVSQSVFFIGKSLIIKPSKWIFSSASEIFSKGLEGIADHFFEGLKGLSLWAQGLFQPLFKSSADFVEKLPLLFKNLGQTLTTSLPFRFVFQIAHFTGSFLANLGDLLVDQWSFWMGAGSEKWEVWYAFFSFHSSALQQRLYAFAESTVDGLVTTLSSFYQTLLTSAKNLYQKLPSISLFTGDIADSFAGISTRLGIVITFCSRKLKKSKEVVSSVIERFVARSKLIVQTIYESIQQRMENVQYAFSGIFLRFNPLPPLRRGIKRVGQSLPVVTFKEWLGRSKGRFSQWITSLVSILYRSFKKILSAIVTLLWWLLQRLAFFVGVFMRRALAVMQRLYSKSKDFFLRLYRYFFK